MDERQAIPLSHSKTAGWLFFTFLACVYFSLAYNASPDYLNLDAYTRGVAPTPYQYRMLPMFLFRALVNRPWIIHIASRAPAELRDPHQVVQLGLTLVSMVGAVLATYGTLKQLTGRDIWFSRWSSLLVVYMAYFTLVPGWGLTYTFPYDTPSLFFFCLGVYLIVSQKVWLYYVMFPLAVLNRETTCFLILFFLIWQWWKGHEESGDTGRKRELGESIIHGIAQALIWFALRKYQMHLFGANTAEGSVGWRYLSGRLFYNLKALLKPQQWPVLLSCSGFLLPVLYAQRRWIRNPGIAWSCAIILPLWFIGMMLVGVIIEIRVFSETIAFTAPAMALILYHRIRRPLTASLG